LLYQYAFVREQIFVENHPWPKNRIRPERDAWIYHAVQTSLDIVCDYRAELSLTGIDGLSAHHNFHIFFIQAQVPNFGPCPKIAPSADDAIADV
jgi:hypothetical protein